MVDLVTTKGHFEINWPLLLYTQNWYSTTKVMLVNIHAFWQLNKETQKKVVRFSTVLHAAELSSRLHLPLLCLVIVFCQKSQYCFSHFRFLRSFFGDGSIKVVRNILHKIQIICNETVLWLNQSVTSNCLHTF